jgi:hypothetical protein
MVEAARIVAKAFSNCMTDRCDVWRFPDCVLMREWDRNSPADESRKWGVYYVVGLAMKCYFKVRSFSSLAMYSQAGRSNEYP